MHPDRSLRAVIMTNTYKVFDSLQGIFHVCSFKVTFHMYACTLGNSHTFWGVGPTLPVLPTWKSRLREFHSLSFYYRRQVSHLGLAPDPNPVFGPDPLLPPTGACVVQGGPSPPAWSQDSALTGGGNAVKSHKGVKAGCSPGQSSRKAVRHEATSPVDACPVFRRQLSEEKCKCQEVIFIENCIFWWCVEQHSQKAVVLLSSLKLTHTGLKANPDSCPLSWRGQWCPQQRHPLGVLNTDLGGWWTAGAACPGPPGLGLTARQGLESRDHLWAMIWHQNKWLALLTGSCAGCTFKRLRQRCLKRRDTILSARLVLLKLNILLHAKNCKKKEDTNFLPHRNDYKQLIERKTCR